MRLVRARWPAPATNKGHAQPWCCKTPGRGRQGTRLGDRFIERSTEMGKKVFANGMEIAHKAGAGKVIAAFPDVCLSPPPPPAGPVPIPYPNTSSATDLRDGSSTVQIGGQPRPQRPELLSKLPFGQRSGHSQLRRCCPDPHHFWKDLTSRLPLWTFSSKANQSAATSTSPPATTQLPGSTHPCPMRRDGGWRLPASRTSGVPVAVTKRAPLRSKEGEEPLKDEYYRIDAREKES